MGMALENNNENITIIQITDTHLMNRDDLEFIHMNPAKNFYAVMEDIQKNYPNITAIFHTGDLAQASVPETYAHYLNYMKTLGIPFYQIPGNHDKAEYFPFYNNVDRAHAIKIGQWTFILLNSAVKGQVHGFITEEQLQQLNDLLLEHKDQHVVVTCHHHPLEIKSRWIDSHKLKNSENLSEVLAKHNNVKMVLCGHVHQDSVNEWKNIFFYSTPSTSVQFKPKSENFALDDIAPGYRVLQLNNNGTFTTKIHRVEGILPKINLEISGY